MHILDPNRKPAGKMFLSINDKGCFRFTRNFIRQEQPDPQERAAIGWDEDGYFLILMKPGDQDYAKGVALAWINRDRDLHFYSKALARYFVAKGGELQNYQLAAGQQFSAKRRIYPILGAEGYKSFLEPQELLGAPAAADPEPARGKVLQNVQ